MKFSMTMPRTLALPMNLLVEPLALRAESPSQLASQREASHPVQGYKARQFIRGVLTPVPFAQVRGIFSPAAGFSCLR